MPDTATMEAIVSLCKRRGFIFLPVKSWRPEWILGLRASWDRPQEQRSRRVVARHGRVPPDGPDERPSRSSALIRPSSRILECGKHRVTWAASTTPWWTAVNPKPGTRGPLGLLGPKGDSTGQIFAFVSGDDTSLSKARKKLEKYVSGTL